MKIVIYFHENQISYPWPPKDPDIRLGRDLHYIYINYTSSLVSNHNYFNSNYHLNSYLDGLKKYLNKMPDLKNKNTLSQIKAKSSVLHIGCNLKKTSDTLTKGSNKFPLILWNHRWEYDKNPEAFFNTLFEINNKGINFSLVVLGEQYNKYPKIFDKARDKLKNNIIHFGYCNSEKNYIQWLRKSDILPVTSLQDFFGVSIIEAISQSVYPILPNRLSYPELFNIEQHSQIYYKSKQEFKNKIINAISNVTSINKYSEKLSQLVLKEYDWSNISTKYDTIFQSLL